MKQFYVKKEKNLKNKKSSSNSKLLQLLLQSKTHYGALRYETQPINKNFIYGFRFNQTILNLQYTIQLIKRACLMVGKILNLKTKIFRQSQKILIITNHPQIMEWNSKYLSNTRVRFITKSWIGGFLTNPALLKQDYKNICLVIAFNVVRDDLLTKAVAKLKLPLISITNTHLYSCNITYPIYINTTNIQSTLLVYYLLVKYLSNYETK